MAFIDEVVIRVQAGAGGRGCVSFRREKYIPRGGPDGGNGGDGGDVYIVGTRDKSSLLDFKYRPRYEADGGEHGQGKDRFGACGADLCLRVPLGTMVIDPVTGELIIDAIEEDVRHLVAKGGKGGRGNLSFASSVLRAPRIATPGEPGETHEVRLELKLLAHVGLIGLPNAGKSSLLRVISRARPKVADYPFTTLEPSLGVVYHKDHNFVVADLPGLIEGAARGAGLGHRFLRHANRTQLLLHLVELKKEPYQIAQDVVMIRKELASYDPGLARREELLVFTKADLWEREVLRKLEKELTRLDLSGFTLSSQSGLGVGALLDHIVGRLRPSITSTALPDLPELCAES